MEAAISSMASASAHRDGPVLIASHLVCLSLPTYDIADVSNPSLECDSLADGDRRRPREEGETCECKDGWGGINCNGRFSPPVHRVTLSLALVCQNDNACIGFPLAGGISSLTEGLNTENMTCYTGGETVFNNHQMCNVTSRSLSFSLPWSNLSLRQKDSRHASRPSTSSNLQL